MALSLERYRHAALSADSVVNNTDPRLTPRNAQKLFLSSLIINNERVPLGKKLVEWHNNIGSQVTNWKCIYRASLHGQSAEDFHRKVDGIGPTYTVAVLKNVRFIILQYGINEKEKLKIHIDTSRRNGCVEDTPMFHGTARRVRSTFHPTVHSYLPSARQPTASEDSMLIKNTSLSVMMPSELSF
jgi:hypothetical protein